MLVYLNDVAEGGRTCWRWCESVAPEWYDAPFPTGQATHPLRPSATPLEVAPTEGTAVLHFAATAPHAGGYTDRNATHEAEPPASGPKYILQQFVWSHEGWGMPRDGGGLDREDRQTQGQTRAHG